MTKFEALVRLTAGILAGNADIAPEAAARHAEKALERIEKTVQALVAAKEEV